MLCIPFPSPSSLFRWFVLVGFNYFAVSSFLCLASSCCLAHGRASVKFTKMKFRFVDTKVKFTWRLFMLVDDVVVLSASLTY